MDNDSDYEFDDTLIEEENYDTLLQEELKIEDYKNVDITEICLHQNTTFNNGVESCSDCGVELYKELSFEAEWRYYGDNDSKHISDPSRCHLRKTEEKSIYKDLEKYELPIDIKQEINNRYMIITKNLIKRGNIRKSYIFGCWYNVFKDMGKPLNFDTLCKTIDISKKEASKGLKFYSIEKSKILLTKEQLHKKSLSTLIPDIMVKFNADEQHISKVTDLYTKIENRSKLLNRSYPRSVIASLIFYYFRLVGGNIDIIKYSKMVDLSDITINKIAKNISDVLKTKDKVNLD